MNENIRAKGKEALKRIAESGPAGESAAAKLAGAEELIWLNPKKKSFEEARKNAGLSQRDIDEAAERLLRFAPLISALFPETEAAGGLIESELREIPKMKKRLADKYGADFGGGRLFMKCDSELAVAGSVKARGGIYEVLKHCETLALRHGILSDTGDDYRKLAAPEARNFFSKHKVQVGSTGNLGMSIGLMSAALGFKAVVHMSSDAKQWKKAHLRAHGVNVVEYAGDYGEAVRRGRAESDADEKSYFVDDENSKDLFLGYAVAAGRLDGQLKEKGITADPAHPLFVCIPCGVGGAPGGIAFGLKQLYGDAIHIFFAEPTQAPCMLLGLASGMQSEVSVQDIGLTGKTEADGLAVGRASGFVGGMIAEQLSGELTLSDFRLYEYLRDLNESEGLFIEPSSCAAFHFARQLSTPELREYIEKNGLEDKMQDAAYIIWATGGALVPEEVRKEFLKATL